MCRRDIGKRGFGREISGNRGVALRSKGEGVLHHVRSKERLLTSLPEGDLQAAGAGLCSTTFF